MLGDSYAAAKVALHRELSHGLELRWRAQLYTHIQMHKNTSIIVYTHTNYKYTNAHSLRNILESKTWIRA